MHQKTLVVIGGGAAGFFCAVNTARLNPNIKVCIYEKSNDVLQKVRISGGGRCNVTHHCFDIEEMAACYPRGSRFVKAAFHHFFVKDTINWFQDRGVPLKTEGDGRMFPVANTSGAITSCLLHEMEKYHVELHKNMEAVSINPLYKGFHIHFRNEEVINADFLLIATGGNWKLSHFYWLNSLGLKIVSPVPSLFTFNLKNNSITQLMGISAANAIVKIAGIKKVTQGAVLITHWGLSGPAVLKLSAFAARELHEADYQYRVIINWCADYHVQTMSEKLMEQKKLAPDKKVLNGNFTGLASRLWNYLAEFTGILPQQKWDELKNNILHQFAQSLCAFTAEASGKTTFKEEFVSAGGINTEQIDPGSMECKKYPGLYFAGEIMNVDGITGGYNFQHAWTSGMIAAMHISQQKP